MIENKAKMRRGQGDRVRQLRDLLDISRPKFAARHPRLSKSNIRNWEEGNKSGLSQSGAESLAAAALSLGVKVSERWLLEGAGQGPVRVAVQPSKNETLSQETAMQLLRGHFGQTMSTRIKDNKLAPELRSGDYVLGKRLSGKQIAKALNALCIVETIDGEIKVGKLEKGKGSSHVLNGKPAQILSASPITLILRNLEA